MERSEREATENGKRRQARRQRSKRREKERARERARGRKRVREMAKSVNFLTFYEPSEFHNLEPVRVVLCTRKVSACAPFSRAHLFPQSSPHPRAALSFSALPRKGKDGPGRKRTEEGSTASRSLPGITQRRRLVLAFSPLRFSNPLCVH